MSDRPSRLTQPIPVPPPGAAVVAVRPTRTEVAPLPHFARPPEAGERRRRRLRQEFGVRIAVTSLLLLFNEAVASDHVMSSIIRLTVCFPFLLWTRMKEHTITCNYVQDIPTALSTLTRYWTR